MTIRIMEAVNLFCGDHDPTDSNHLSLSELKFPDIEEMTIEHTPGGGVMGVEFSIPVIKAMMATFKLRDFNPVRLQQFGLNTPVRRNYTAYGAIRDKKTGSLMQAKIVLDARMSSLSMDAFSRGKEFDTQYTLKEIMAYYLEVDGAPVWDIDFWTNTFSVGGVSQTEELNRVLAIPIV